MKKRLICLLLCFAILVALPCTQAFAATSTYSDLIDDVFSRFQSGNSSASGAPQQAVNGLYRCVEMSMIIAYELN